MINEQEFIKVLKEDCRQLTNEDVKRLGELISALATIEYNHHLQQEKGDK